MTSSSAAASLWKIRCWDSGIAKPRNMVAISPSTLPADGPNIHCW
ncbi:Uncharacterised protein [Mycobacterium tuberculosis]|nr:Uncharacterised protein [Mycobacterium tuberculosis]